MSDAELSADEISLPIKRTEGETLADRLTDNAYHNILPARYLRKDADGDLVEQQEDLFERVAKNIALAEAVFESRKRDIDVTVTPDDARMRAQSQAAPVRSKWSRFVQWNQVVL